MRGAGREHVRQREVDLGICRSIPDTLNEAQLKWSARGFVSSPPTVIVADSRHPE